MSKIEKIVRTASAGDNGAMDRVAAGMGLSREELARRFLAISHGKLVRTHQNSHR